jgi:O-antigen ligase
MDVSGVKKYAYVVPLLALLLAIAGMFIARAMVSIGMIALVCWAIVFTNPLKTFRIFFKDPVFIAFSLVFAVYLLSGINSTEDKPFLMERIRLKLPFLALPVAFTIFKDKMPRRLFYGLLCFFLAVVSISSMVITWQYAMHYERINDLYVEGRVMETPFSHIRYSLMVAFAIFCGYTLLIQDFYFKYKWEKWVIISLSVFLVFFIHLLAVRSGLAAFYLCILYLIFHFIFTQRRPLQALILTAAIILLPVMAYFILPSVKAKVNYMKYDLEQLLLFKNASGLSDGGRILSIEKGMEIFRENFWTGSGIGDLQQEMKRKLELAPEHPRDYLLPHNQFVFTAAGTGIFGLLVFCVAIFLPLFNRKNLRNNLFICFYIIVLSSFFTEATVEEQMGTAFYLVFLLLLHVHIQSEPT